MCCKEIIIIINNNKFGTNFYGRGSEVTVLEFIYIHGCLRYYHVTYNYIAYVHAYVGIVVTVRLFIIYSLPWMPFEQMLVYKLSVLTFNSVYSSKF